MKYSLFDNKKISAFLLSDSGKNSMYTIILK